MTKKGWVRKCYDALLARAATNYLYMYERVSVYIAGTLKFSQIAFQNEGHTHKSSFSYSHFLFIFRSRL